MWQPAMNTITAIGRQEYAPICIPAPPAMVAVGSKPLSMFSLSTATAVHVVWTRAVVILARILPTATKMDTDTTTRRLDSPGPQEDVRPTKKARLDGPSGADMVASTSKLQPPSKKKQKLSKRNLRKLTQPEQGTPDDVLWHEVRELLGEDVVDDAIDRGVDLQTPVKFGDILELDVKELGSNGLYDSFLPQLGLMVFRRSFVETSRAASTMDCDHTICFAWRGSPRRHEIPVLCSPMSRESASRLYEAVV